MDSVVLLIFWSRLLLYATVSLVIRVKVVLSGFSVRLLCLVQTKNFIFVCIFGYTRACMCKCDVDV